jgi:septal ring factor EnvC (AmiA/AmiB activator)
MNKEAATMSSQINQQTEQLQKLTKELDTTKNQLQVISQDRDSLKVAICSLKTMLRAIEDGMMIFKLVMLV